MALSVTPPHNGNTVNIEQVQTAAFRAGNAGDLRALVGLAGHVASLIRLGAPTPATVRWLWDAQPIVGGEQHSPLALGGPNLLELWADEEKHAEVEKWLARALGRAYAGDWGSIDRGDRGANERSLTDGSRLMCVYPWFGEPEGNRDLWVWIEAQHLEDIPNANLIRRVSVTHRADY